MLSVSHPRAGGIASGAGDAGSMRVGDPCGRNIPFADTRGRAADAYGHEAVDGDDAGAAALFAGGIWPDTGGGFGGGWA